MCVILVMVLVLDADLCSLRWKTRPPFKDPTIHAHGGDTREPVVPDVDDDDVDLSKLGSKRGNEGKLLLFSHSVVQDLISLCLNLDV